MSCRQCLLSTSGPVMATSRYTHTRIANSVFNTSTPFLGLQLHRSAVLGRPPAPGVRQAPAHPSSAAAPMAMSTSTPAAASAMEAPSSPQELWSRVLQVYDRAQAIGAASSIDTKEEYCMDASLGVEYVLRVATALKAKPQGPPATTPALPPASLSNSDNTTSTSSKGDSSTSSSSTDGTTPAPAHSPSSHSQPHAQLPKAWKNPFLPPEPDLYVCPLPPSHALVLNKFNVVAHHLLVITQEFQSQTDPLYAADLAATWSVLQAMPSGGVAFYNCGPNSGRSQPHKHVQIVPLPFAQGRPALMPIQPIIDASIAALGGSSAVQPLQPFDVRSMPCRAHAALLPASPSSQQLEGAFSTLLCRCTEAFQTDQQVSYNMLLTAQVMLLVPRGAERVGPCAFNALAFAGTALVRSDEELAFVKDTGPTHVLAQAGVPWPV